MRDSNLGVISVMWRLAGVKSGCAVTFYSDLLTDNDPNPPPIPLKQIRRSSSNKKWTVINFVAVRMTFGLCYPFCIFPFDGGRNGVV